MSDETQEISLEDFEVKQEREAGAEVEIDAEVPPVRPLMTDSDAWNEFVIRQFKDDELVDGNPTVDGLRRVAELLLGEIIFSVSKIAQAPNLANGMHAAVEHKLKILWEADNDVDDDRRGTRVRTFGDVADVYCGNTDELYARYASATAATRAEGRALRKALKLKRIVAAEEITKIDIEEAGLDGKIVIAQIRAIDTICARLNVSAWAFLNCGKTKYQKLKDIGASTALKMIEALNTLTQATTKIKDEWKGYDKDWRSKYE